jgi:hypothetical protein
MMKSIYQRNSFWLRIGWLLLGVLVVSGSRDLFLRAMGTGDGEFLGHFSVKWGMGLIGYSLLAWGVMFIVVYGVLRTVEVESKWIPQIETQIDRIHFFRWPIALISLAFPSCLLLGPWGWRFDLPNFRILLVVIFSLIAGLLFPRRLGHWIVRGMIALLVSSSVVLIGQRLLQVTNYPFALSWSEGNRLWDYSLYFGRDRYDIVGEFNYPSYLTPGRHGLWGLPFLFFSQISIEHMRLWDALLWILPHMFLGGVIIGTQRSDHVLLRLWPFALWGFLFLSQGPIYAPLILSAIIFVLGYRRNWLWQSALATAAACFYAGISRWTWMLSPAIWGFVWAILDEDPAKAFWRRIRRPLLLGFAGVIGAVLSQIFMDLAFPSTGPVYSTSLSQPLLWYRLWPSPTNPTGVIPGLIYGVGPLLLWLAWSFLSRRVKLDWLQGAVTLVAFLGFLGAGLIASVKIGGGSNLHNLDMFLVTLVLFTGYLITQKGVLRSMPSFAWVLLLAAVFIPTWNLVREGQQLHLPSNKDVREALASIRYLTKRAAERGEVLFIDERQLLTFGEITDVPLVMDYELKDMMNQAMGSNRAYFERFYIDLSHHRFQLIISDPLNTILKGPSESFGEENDAWVRYVSMPILRYYEPLLKADKVSVWLLVPKREDRRR